MNNYKLEASILISLLFGFWMWLNSEFHWQVFAISTVVALVVCRLFCIASTAIRQGEAGR